MSKKVIIPIIILLLGGGIAYYWLGIDNQDKVTDTISKNKSSDNADSIDISKIEYYLNHQMFDKVIPILEEKYKQNKNDLTNVLAYTSALLSKGNITRQEKEYADKAIKILKEAVKQYPKEAEIYRQLGYAYEIKEDYDKAFSYYDKAIELDPKNALAYAGRGHAYKLYGDYFKAEKDFTKAYKLDPNNDFVALNMAWIYNVEIHDLNEAIKLYKKVIEITDNTRFKAEAYHSLGLIYTAKGMYEEAEKSFKEAIKQDEKFELGYIGLSDVNMLKLVYRSEGKTEEEKEKILKEALKNLDISIALNPKKAIAYMKKGIIMNDIDKKEARLLFQLALDAVDVDNTLGKREKKELKIYINKLIKDENNN